MRKEGRKEGSEEGKEGMNEGRKQRRTEEPKKDEGNGKCERKRFNLYTALISSMANKI